MKNNLCLALLVVLAAVQGEPCHYPYSAPGFALSGHPGGKAVEKEKLEDAKVECIKLNAMCSGITQQGNGKYTLHSSGELAAVSGALSWPKVCGGQLYQTLPASAHRTKGKMVSPGPLDGIVRTRQFFPNAPEAVPSDTRESRGYPPPPPKKQSKFWKAMVKYLIGNGPKQPVKAEDLEDCIGCRFIWSQVENDIGYSRLESQVYETFTKFCRQAETTYMFFATCQDMFDRLDDMVVGYMKGWSVNQMCDYSDQCRPVLLTMGQSNGATTKKQKSSISKLG